MSSKMWPKTGYAPELGKREEEVVAKAMREQKSEVALRARRHAIIERIRKAREVHGSGSNVGYEAFVSELRDIAHKLGEYRPLDREQRRIDRKEREGAAKRERAQPAGYVEGLPIRFAYLLMMHRDGLHPDKERRRVTVAYQERHDHLAVAFAVCHPNDRFTKAEGRSVATERLRGGLYFMIDKPSGKVDMSDRFAYEARTVYEAAFAELLTLQLRLQRLGAPVTSQYPRGNWRVVVRERQVKREAS